MLPGLGGWTGRRAASFSSARVAPLPRRQRGAMLGEVRGSGAAMTMLEGRGWQRSGTFEIPFGPVCSFRAPGGQRLAIYERTRPEVEAHFAGRRDF